MTVTGLIMWVSYNVTNIVNNTGWRGPLGIFALWYSHRLKPMLSKSYIKTVVKQPPYYKRGSN